MTTPSMFLPTRIPCAARRSASSRRSSNVKTSRTCSGTGDYFALRAMADLAACSGSAPRWWVLGRVASGRSGSWPPGWSDRALFCLPIRAKQYTVVPGAGKQEGRLHPAPFSSRSNHYPASERGLVAPSMHDCVHGMALSSPCSPSRRAPLAFAANVEFGRDRPRTRRGGAGGYPLPNARGI